MFHLLSTWKALEIGLVWYRQCKEMYAKVTWETGYQLVIFVQIKRWEFPRFFSRDKLHTQHWPTISSFNKEVGYLQVNQKQSSFLFLFFSVVCLVFSLLQLCSLTCTTLVHKCSFMFSIWFQIMSFYWHSGTFSLKTDVNNMSWEYWKVTKSIKPVAAAYAYLGIAFLGARFFKIHCYGNIDYSHNKVLFWKKNG